MPGAGLTTDALRKIRGSLFTARGAVPMGPRPNQPDNIISWGEYANGHYQQDAADICFQVWAQRRYTHAAVGPFIDPGYHGQVPPFDFRADPDAVVSRLETMLSRGIIPVGFIGPDNWTLDQMRTLEPIFRQPRWQAALKLIVPMGFEPSKDTPNATYVDWFRWAGDVFPQALIYYHSPSDFDAPGNNDDLTPGTSKWIGPAECWRRVAPYLHGFLGQYGPFEHGPTHPDEQEHVIEFQKLFKDNRFKTGYAGWPTFSKWGAHVPLDYHAAEYCSYSAWWQNLPESACRAWGDVAMGAGASGAFDGVN